MPSALVAALAAPIREVQSLVGPGWSGDPFADPAVALGRARDALTDVSAATRQAWDRTNWTGSGADAAAEFTASTVAAIDGLAARADQLSTTAGDASAAVARAHEKLQGIVDRFEARAQALEPSLDSPGVAEQLMTEAQRSLAEAVAVVEELQAELDAHATVLATSTQPASAPTAPAGLTSAGMPAVGSGPGGGAVPMSSGLGGGASPMSSGLGGGASPMSSGLGGGASPMSPLSNGSSGSGLGDLAQLMKPDAPTEIPEAAAFGDGVAIRLPDGSIASAPNTVAASAVRHALTQLGVPYDWGGTSPGVGLDCSGLTQWAYSEAGLNLPRLAQEQDVGAPVAAGDLRPGDLAVWDGHVAMVVGNGQMVEAGDPVKLSSIRTDNAGQGFQGFWRPTA